MKNLHANNKHTHGFTLVELSIVLVIIGLLIGGILVGQSLINSAKIQRQLRQFEQYDIAATNFKTKYKQIPGDCSVCEHYGSNTAYIGNNNGRLEHHSAGATPPLSVYAEPQFYFGDLYTMGQIQERFCPAGSGCNPSSYSFGKNQAFPYAILGDKAGLIVTGKMDGSVYYTLASTTGVTDASYANMLSKPVLTVEQAIAVDTKIDDGYPGSGDVGAVLNSPAPTNSIFPLVYNSGDGCAVNTQTYDTSNPSAVTCRIVVKAQIKK